MEELFVFIQVSNGGGGGEGCAMIVEGEGQMTVVNHIGFESIV